ncbi:MAG: hypothetical protein IJT73_03145 [Selenomonadaceae bacterium]|nr:hypothetical protein [Selenomonadaceae bacterium]
MSDYRLTAAAVMTVIIAGGLFLYEPPKPEKIERPQKVEQEKIPVQGVGYIDFEQVIHKHRDGEKLKELLGKEIRLKLELNEIMRPFIPPKLPEIDITPFEDSTREKIMQNLISQLAEIRARKKRLTEEYQKEHEPEYIKRRNEIRDIYSNEAFNITLKIENAKTLHLTPEEIQALAKRLDELVLERNEKQRALLEEWTAEVAAYVNSQVADDEARIKRETDETKEKYSAEALQKIRDTQARNKALLEAAMQEVAFRQTRRRELISEIARTAREREKLENSIIDSITNETGKLGALYKLQMIFVQNSPPKLDKKFLRNIVKKADIDTPKSPGAMIFEGKDTKDLTPDLLKTMH